MAQKFLLLEACSTSKHCGAAIVTICNFAYISLFISENDYAPTPSRPARIMRKTAGSPWR
jgi:hypothetical protein